MRRGRTIISLILTALIFGAGGLGVVYLLRTAPQTQPREEVRAAKIVQVIPLRPKSEHLTVTAYGQVVPARELSVKPQVSGQILDLHPSLEPGGFIPKDETLFHIDPADYELALTEKRAELEEAKFEAAVEEGRQVVAEREWDELKRDLPDGDVNQSLVLREPHLKRTQAMLDKAQNAIKKAELDLARAKVAAPFNAMVLEESLEQGQLVEDGGEVCKLVGTDEFWIRATLPVSDLKWIELPEGDQAGAKATVFLDTGDGTTATWEGQVTRLLSDIETTGRMARVLIAIPDPMGLDRQAPEKPVPLLLGSYLRAEISAGQLDGVLTIPRKALREGDRIWVVGTDNKLRIVDAHILWTRPDSVLIENTLKPDESLVVSDLKSALPGLLVNPQPVREGGGKENEPGQSTGKAMDVSGQ